MLIVDSDSSWFFYAYTLIGYLNSALEQDCSAYISPDEEISIHQGEELIATKRDTATILAVLYEG